MPRARSHAIDLNVAGNAPLSVLPRVGPVLAGKCAARGIFTLQDLWLLLPLRYEDRTRLTPIAELQDGVAVQIEARVEAVERSFRYRPLLRVVLSDDAHHILTMRFSIFAPHRLHGLLSAHGCVRMAYPNLANMVGRLSIPATAFLPLVKLSASMTAWTRCIR